LSSCKKQEGLVKKDWFLFAAKVRAFRGKNNAQPCGEKEIAEKRQLFTPWFLYGTRKK